MSRLTYKQKCFVAEYLVDMNATQAAIRAGYSPKTANEQSSRLLAKVNVQAALQQSMKKREQRTEITQDLVLTELANIAFANGSDFAKVVKGGKVVELVDTDELSPEKRAAISSIEETKFGIKVSTCDKVRALELIGKHLGMFDGKTAKGSKDENNLLETIVEGTKEDINTDDIPEIQ